MSRRKRPDRKKLTRRRRPHPAVNPPEAAFPPLLPDLFGVVDDELAMWTDEQGLHALVPGRPAPDTFQRLTELYQQKIRNSPQWDQMVSEFGLDKAEQRLQEFRAQPG